MSVFSFIYLIMLDNSKVPRFLNIRGFFLFLLALQSALNTEMVFDQNVQNCENANPTSFSAGVKSSVSLIQSET